MTQRKVTKYNQVSYKAQHFNIPPGHSGLKIELIEYEDRLEFYYKDQLLVTYPYHVVIIPKNKTKNHRKIKQNGEISYKGKRYTIDYKYAGKTVEVQETNLGKELLVYLHGILLTTLKLK